MTEPKPTEQPQTPESPVERVLGDEVLADARRRAERIRRRGRRDAERIRRQAEKEAQRVAEEILSEAHRRAEHSARMILATLDVEVHKATLNLKEEIVQACLEAAWRKLLRKDDYDYPAVVTRLAVSALARMPGREFILQVSNEDRDRLPEDLPRRIEEAVQREHHREVKVRLAAEPGRFAGGCVVLSADGRLRYDNSFEARRRRLQQQLRRTAAQALFGDEESDRDHH